MASTIASYRNSALFDVLGLSSVMVNECFGSAYALIGGLGYEDIEERILRNHALAYELNLTKKLFPLEIGGFYKYTDGNEYHDYHLFYDNIENNQIAKYIFDFDRTNVLPYNNQVGPLSKIYGFLIEISNGTDFLTIYKRNQATNAINPKKVINFLTGTDNKLQLIQQNAIYMNKQIDIDGVHFEADEDIKKYSSIGLKTIW